MYRYTIMYNKRYKDSTVHVRVHMFRFIMYMSVLNGLFISGVYILVRKRYLFPHPFPKMIFFPSLKHIVFWHLSCPFGIIIPLFATILSFTIFSFYFPFLPLSSPFLPFLPFSFPFLPIRFPPFPLFIFLPPNETG
jgi:hypothetical protein